MCLNVNFGMLDGFNLDPILASDLLNELDVDSVTRKMIKLLDKQVIVNAWAYAGNGCFESDGSYLENEKIGCYKWKIEYKDLITFKEHFYFLDGIFTKKINTRHFL